MFYPLNYDSFVAANALYIVETLAGVCLGEKTPFPVVAILDDVLRNARKGEAGLSRYVSSLMFGDQYELNLFSDRGFQNNGVR